MKLRQLGDHTKDYIADDDAFGVFPVSTTGPLEDQVKALEQHLSQSESQRKLLEELAPKVGFLSFRMVGIFSFPLLREIIYQLFVITGEGT